VQIIRYANRLKILNPGFSLKSQDHLGEPGSQLRNPKIAGAPPADTLSKQAEAFLICQLLRALNFRT